jgi:hypothetical protein
MNKQDIIKMLTVIESLYGGKSTSELKQHIQLQANIWLEILGGYDKELAMKAFYDVCKTEKYRITPAHIVEQIEKIENAFGKSDQELWAEFRRVLNKANDCVYKLKFKMIEENGKTQGENAQLELERLYEGLPLPLQRYCGNVSGLKDLSQLDDESLEFEKARFLKDIGKKKAEIKIQQECPQFAELAQGTLKALEGLK